MPRVPSDTGNCSDHSPSSALHNRNAAAPQSLPDQERRKRNFEDDAMENFDSWRAWIREQWRRTVDAQTSVAVIFAGIAALFIAGIAAALIYAKDTNPTQTASVDEG